MTLKEFHDMLGFELEHNHAPDIDIRLTYRQFFDIWTDIHRIITYNENMKRDTKNEKEN